MRIKYTCLYADSEGESHFKDVEVELQETNYAPPARPLNVSSINPATAYGFVSAPPGWYGDWHPAPKRQFFIYIAGEAEIEASDGEVRRIGAGDILLVEDITGKGHRSRNVGLTEVLSANVHLPS
jgi:quercetin dioxygenase-like cupin family protein